MAAPASGERKKKSSKKDKPSSSSRSASKDREKPKSSKKSPKKSSSSSRSAPLPAVAEQVPPAAGVQHKAPQDPDAIQLFRRYDRARAGALTRLDFLQLLKDYANPPTGVQQHSNNNGPHTQSSTPALAHLRPRKPLSLTDTSGIPLGYERSDKNSEFEAGQLFERYDKDRTGALTLDKFHTFFEDFKPQLTAFVEDLSYFVAPPQFASAASSSSPDTSSRVDATASSSSSHSAVDAKSSHMLDPKAKEDQKRQLKSEYKTLLWNMRKLFRDELLSQRERILEMVGGVGLYAKLTSRFALH
uniref:EF-hand domain-containing protein n=1 Tax=Globisporangium ultimum (strain ATCC 200006 / CBS 805.95 / DAOM BR144) TaxID=431595 RepID=K3WFE2_GLOUD